MEWRRVRRYDAAEGLGGRLVEYHMRNPEFQSAKQNHM